MMSLCLDTRPAALQSPGPLRFRASCCSFQSSPWPPAVRLALQAAECFRLGKCLSSGAEDQEVLGSWTAYSIAAFAELAVAATAVADAVGFAEVQ